VKVRRAPLSGRVVVLNAPSCLDASDHDAATALVAVLTVQIQLVLFFCMGSGRRGGADAAGARPRSPGERQRWGVCDGAMHASRVSPGTSPSRRVMRVLSNGLSYVVPRSVPQISHLLPDWPRFDPIVRRSDCGQTPPDPRRQLFIELMQAHSLTSLLKDMKVCRQCK
jgi:hypothetical protein